MKTLLITLLLIGMGAVVVYASGCFFKRSYVSGMNRICIYHCIDGDRAITIKSYEICPISL